MAYQSKKHRKFLATSMTAALVATAVAPAAGSAASNFTDVPADNFYYEYVKALADANIIDGRPDGSFDLGGKVTRAEASKMLANILQLDTKTAPAANFSDVKQDAWYAGYVNALSAKGLINGKGDGKFDPNGTLTRAEFAKMVVEAYDLELKADGPVASFTDINGKWYTDYVKILFSHGLITGTTSTTFSPEAQIKRGDFAKLLVVSDREYGITLGAAKVTGVSAINPTTLKVEGTGLKNLKADQISVEGNTVTAVTPAADGKSATVTLGTALVPDKEVTVTVGSGDSKKDFKVKFTFNVTSVAVTTTQVDDDKDAQKLAFSVNGVAADLDWLTNVAGYNVQFQADKVVFTTGTTSSTGEIDEGAADVAINKTFKVKVVLTKGGNVYESALTEVKVVNENATPAIGSLVIEDSSNTALNSKTLVVGETYTVTEVRSSTNEVINLSGVAQFSSSNNAVATVDPNTGVITPVAPGTVKITATAGDKTYSVDLTVTNTARKVASITAPSSIKLAPGASQTVAVEVKDQYGDYFNITVGNVVESSSNAKITYGQTTQGANKGKATLTITAAADTAVGNYNVYLKDSNGVLLKTITVTVTTANTADTSKSKLEIANGSESTDNVLDATKSSDDSVTLNVNEYSTDGGFIGTVTGTASQPAANTQTIGTYTVEVADPTVAQVETDVNGNVVVVPATPVKAGSTAIILKDSNGVVVNTYTVTVQNDPIKVTGINWKNTGTIVASGYVLSVADALQIDKVDNDDIVKGLTLSKTTSAKVRIDEADLTTGTADIYLDKNDNGVNDGASEKLGEITVTVAPGATGLTVTNLGTIDTTASGDKGTLVFKFTDTVSSPSQVLASTTVNVDVK